MKKNISSLIYLIIGILIGILVVFFINTAKDKPKDVPTNNASQSESLDEKDDIDKKDEDEKEDKKSEKKLEIKKDFYKDVLYELEETGDKFEKELDSGNYVVGVDIPVGVYKLEVVKGVGKIDINNKQQEIFISEEISNDAKIYDDTYTSISNLKFYDNTVVSIKGANVKIVSENAQTKKLRQQSKNTENIKELNLSSVYEAGVDFKAGVYDIEYIEGVGNVVTEDMDKDGLDISFMEGEEMSKTYKNVELSEGTKLYINGVKIKLKPSKRGFEINK